MPLPEFAFKLRTFGTEFSKVTRHLLTEIKPEEITLLQFEILHFLYTEGSATFGQIGACTGMSLPNTSREVKKLIQKKLVTKRADIKDKRVYFVELSPSGKELMTASSSKLERLISGQYAHLNPEDVSEVMQALDLLSEKLLGE
ncbi:DNA-binding transcriptional regulator, MarR family [Paenibacillus sophorae]|uniref:DNA-binding transcriptional regulator, MarR family n=1 Tax=Paenibacillus sophorae TaxID=1333845 RepID=A0A1H8IX31_9BACL|nr:MarR family winged helix-turn-helix transcriptional regulator [Paenibacillus sophorae]QWU16102.1 MarR family winged helix-turn-helix transcriptional regulator [Paenibacillus sophorae]SEN72596.1 DNA-binding transcriptional regulator, MarR family [Paenibacillus sophorae]